MVSAKSSEADFIRLFEEEGPAETARRLEVAISNVFKRRRVLERKYGRPINGPDEGRNRSEPITAIPGRLHTNVEDGVVLVGGDLHAWPGEPSTAFRAFLKFCRKLEPKVVIMNGDVIDGATVSRHPPIGWDKLPSLVEELEAASDLLQQVALAVPQSTELFWPLGNHDARLETRIATVAPELANMKGTHLRDHFSERWQACWSVWINDEVVVKHRARSGIHATWNNVINSGKSMVTNHLHSLRVTPFSDYNPRPKFGVDAGCLADTYGPQFRYLEDGTRNWRSGFAVLTFKDGELLWPELVFARGPGEVEWRGEVVNV
jgi:hypothetical protein